MIVIFWVLLKILFFILLTVLAFYSLKSFKTNLSLGMFDGFRDNLKEHGLFTKRFYPVELYKWVPIDDDDVCEDCLQRAGWPPMDIADWMKEGLPGTPEAHTHCAHRCRCRLELHERRFVKRFLKKNYPDRV